MSNDNNARYMSRELREKYPNANIKICFKVQATAARPHLHIEGFPLSTIESSTKGPPLRITPSTNKKYITLTLTPLHKREGTKLSTKERENYNLVIT